MTGLLGHPQKQGVGGVIQLQFRGLRGARQGLGQWVAVWIDLLTKFAGLVEPGETNCGTLRHQTSMRVPEGHPGHDCLEQERSYSSRTEDMVKLERKS